MFYERIRLGCAGVQKQVLGHLRRPRFGENKSDGGVDMTENDGNKPRGEEMEVE